MPGTLTLYNLKHQVLQQAYFEDNDHRAELLTLWARLLPEEPYYYQISLDEVEEENNMK